MAPEKIKSEHKRIKLSSELNSGDVRKQLWCMSNTLAADFKLIKSTVPFALRVYDVRNLLAFIPI